jgi:hypothetical protein
MTTAQDDGGKVVSLTHRPPLPQEIHLVSEFVVFTEIYNGDGIIIG